ncbi:glutathione S-transferase omega-1-like isoform X2 [Crassostrea virginica]
MSSSKSFSAGSDCPSLEPGTLRLYSMRFCPYAHRTRLVLAHKNIPHEVINIDLKNKPDWFLEKNPLGRVPTLEQDQRIVFESLICGDYLDQVYPDNGLTPSDPYRQAQDKMLLEMCSQFTSDFHKTTQSAQGITPEGAQKIREHFTRFENTLKDRQGAFYGGSACPSLEPGTLRLYSMRFCPYAHRTRLVLAHKNIPHEVVNIDQKNKPDWFLEKNPLGKVPTLEQDQRIVFDSLICCDYLDEVYPENRLTPNDPYRQAQDKMLLMFFSQFISDVPRAMQSAPGENPEAVQKIRDHFTRFEDTLKDRQSAYFGGQTLQMVDLMMWPWIEQFLMFTKTKPHEHVISVENYPLFLQWAVLMSKSPAVVTCRVPVKDFVGFFKSVLRGAPNFDIGLDE